MRSVAPPVPIRRRTRVRMAAGLVLVTAFLVFDAWLSFGNGEAVHAAETIASLFFGTAIIAALIFATHRRRSEQRRVAEAVRESEDRLRLFFDHAPASLAMFDREMRYLHVSNRWRADYKLGDREIAGVSHYDIFPEIGDAWKRAHARALAGEVVTSERDTFVRADGSKRYLRWEARPWMRGAEIGGIVIITEDITDVTLAAEEARALALEKTVWNLTEDVARTADLRAARIAAESASTAKSEFLSSMSHELRTPLNAILGFAQLALRDKKDPLGERNHERVSQIMKSGEHLLRLVDDILDLSRIEANGITVAIEPVNVEQVLDEVRTTLDPLASDRHVDMKLDAVPTEMPLVAADPMRFSQILMNFGTNAIKYNRADGSVVFSTSMPQKDTVRVTVKDTGIGISPDAQKSLFSPFNRAGQEAGPIEGTGIGLVIAQKLARSMHGDVGFTSVLGRGSEFYVDIPVYAKS